jgi:hypothetical protein
MALIQGMSESLGRTVRDSLEYGKVFWVILDAVVPYLCSKQFWKKNADVSNIRFWRRLFELFRSLLPVASTATTPEYVPELLRRRKVENSVDYWGLVAAAHSITPTVVEQCVDMQERHICRIHLAEAVEQAMNDAESLNIANDFNDSQHWHDEYGSISEECKDYAEIYPEDEEIPRVDELSKVIDDNPRLDNEPDDDHDFTSARSSSSSSDEDIEEIFSDL